jgi:hypothetical protein
VKRLLIPTLAVIALVPCGLAIVDVNNNGLSDFWEKQYNNGNLFGTSFDPEGDEDGDGWSNAKEAVSGTDPKDGKPPAGFLTPETIHNPSVWVDTDNDGIADTQTAETAEVKWPSFAGKQYQLYGSPDLMPGTWLEVDESRMGTGSVIGLVIPLAQPGGTAPERLFWRVAVRNVDTDSDGVTDAEEYENDSDPENADSDGDGLSDMEEAKLGTDPNLVDTDGDETGDAEDAVPLDIAINWKKSAEPSYVFIELEDYDPAAHGNPIMSNKQGRVLCKKAVWADGVWIPINGVASGFTASNTWRCQVNGEPEPVDIQLHFGAKPTSMDDEGIIAGYGIVADQQHGIVFEMNKSLVWSSPAALPQLLGEPGIITENSPDTPSMEAAYITRDGDIAGLSGGWLTNTDGLVRVFHGMSQGAADYEAVVDIDFSGSGYSTPSRDGTFAGMDYQLGIGMPWVMRTKGSVQEEFLGDTNTLTPLPSSDPINFDLEPVAAGTTPPTGTQSNVVEHPAIANGTDFLIHNGEKWVSSESLKGARMLSKCGTALTSMTDAATGIDKPAVWRNGKVVKITDICPSLVASGITDFTMEDINDQGVILIRSGMLDRIGLLVPVEVRWEAIEDFDNVDDHIDPWNKPIHGKRIFPDFKDPDDTTIRHKLHLLVKTHPALAGKTVYVKAFDVDDSTSEEFDLNLEGTEPVIDTNGKSGGDNLPDYLNTQLGGQFWDEDTSAWGGQTMTGVVDANGETKFDFRVGMQPGNNYRVVASVDDESMYDGVQVTNANADKYLGPGDSQTGGASASPLLTVWRRLWVENDSMEAIPIEDGIKRNDLSADTPNPIVNAATLNAAGTDTVFYISPISDASSFLNLENGQIIVQNVVHPVTGAGILIDDHVVSVAGNHTSVPNGSSFRLYDDDDFGLDAPPLPRNDLVDDLMKSFFRPSFIEVTDSGDFNTRKTVPFRKNDDLQTSSLLHPSNTVVNSSKDLTEKDALWVCQLTAAYQFETTEDGDPNSEDATYGGTRQFLDYDHSTVFVENCREAYNDQFLLVAEQGSNPAIGDQARMNLGNFIIATAAHEMGHHPGALSVNDEHSELGLMRDGGVLLNSPQEEKFTASTISRFRKSQKWSKK